MAVWDELTGQSEAIAIFAAAASASSAGGSGHSSMTHSWLITGPPGSGRSNLAFAFATALLSSNPEGDESVRKQVEARTHPDLAVLSTDRVIISIEEVRQLVATSQYSPSVGRFRVVIIEDADRMTERTSNVLLKALEEPPPRTVWILCAPSEADLIPTIRSRVRTVQLRVPAVADVAELIHRRDGVDLEQATRAAREAQSHIGMAHRLATNAEARDRRGRTLQLALGIRSVSSAVIAASTLLQLATDDAKAITEERDAEEREGTLRSLGIEPGGTIPPALRAQLKNLEDDQKRRATRSLRDGLDRILVDLLSLYRDVLLLQLEVQGELINLSIEPQLAAAAAEATAPQTLKTMDAIATARTRIAGNVAPALALEAMLVSAVRRGVSAVMLRRVALAAAALALVLPVSGCLESFLPPSVRSTSEPTGERVAADLESYYTQQLVWTGCGTDLQCATAEAPLDWNDPQRESIDLALIRQVATGGTPIGSLLVNPGGPGGSGYDFIRDSLDYAVDERLQESFDVVGFDPRGVNHSSAVSCYDDPADFDAFLFDLLPGEYGSDEWIEALRAANERFGEDCEQHTGELLGYVDTVSAARDLDLLRAILGDTTLTYLGYSYGTLLGATYAELYPEKTGRLVFDGALDPATSSFDVSATQAQGFESALRAFLADCNSHEDCPFGRSVESSMDDIRDLLDRLDASPIRNEDGRELGSSAMTVAIITPLYSEDNWPILRQIFTDVMRGDAGYAFQIADFYYGRNADGTYADNSTEAFLAINCLDYATDGSLETMRAEEAELQRLAPVLGRQLAYGGTGCAGWPYESTRVREPIAAAGSSEILVLGTINDPATPYVWAQAMAQQLQNGHLVTYDGEGHTAYNKGSDCINEVVDDYFIEGVVPASDPRC